MQKIERRTATTCEFYFHNHPIMTIEQGESFQIETDDAPTGMIKNASTTRTVHGMIDETHVTSIEYPIN